MTPVLRPKRLTGGEQSVKYKVEDFRGITGHSPLPPRVPPLGVCSIALLYAVHVLAQFMRLLGHVVLLRCYTQGLAAKIVRRIRMHHEEDHRVHDPCNRGSRFFWPHCTEACAQHSWLCCGGLRRPKLLIDGNNLAAPATRAYGCSNSAIHSVTACHSHTEIGRRCGTNAAVTQAGRLIGTPSPNANGVQYGRPRRSFCSQKYFPGSSFREAGRQGAQLNRSG